MSFFDDCQEDYWAMVDAGVLNPAQTTFDNFVLDGGAGGMGEKALLAIGAQQSVRITRDPSPRRSKKKK